jgi:phosphinothricin acetyltransferase
MKLSPVLPCTERHLPAILEIWNEAILNTTVVYDYQPRTLPMVEAWFAQRKAANFPVLGVESEDGALVGFATYGPFRAFPAYKYTVEHSVYVDKTRRSHGVGKILMYALINAAEKQDLHVMIGAIDSDNIGSIRFHRAFGFEPCGTIRQAAFKFGRWLDVDFYQLTLHTPALPVDG